MHGLAYFDKTSFKFREDLMIVIRKEERQTFVKVVGIIRTNTSKVTGR